MSEAPHPRSGVFEFRREERRRQRRLAVADPIRARTGATPVLVYDVSRCGLRIVHASHVARVGETLMLVVDWEGHTIQLNCEVRRTEMKHTDEDSTNPRQVFETGLLIAFAEEPSLRALETLLEAESRKASAQAMLKRTASIAMPPR